ncbi:hypothetical protein PIN31009_03009 [Pandoraea iniqua]|uniref:AAA family ATPase n=1 Tax=Pandoraea iniqua TaxID=2508288 RepID=UPI001251703F|nr:AAA family ATPase [Pandoraea iniqua]VVE18570.1 hypothetical protein PIN31009_03009 [Pandoraea iniqua]
MLTSFSVENYRAFARPQQIDVRPITLFFGWNSGGKSALIRFLPLLAESLEADASPIWLAGTVGRRATWPELVCGATKRLSLNFGLTWNLEGRERSASWEIGGDAEGTYQQINRLVANGLSGESTFDGMEPRLPRHPLNSLIPDFSVNDADKNLLLGLKADLDDFRKQVQWVSGVRARPARFVAYGGGQPSHLSPDGIESVDYLVADSLEPGDDILMQSVATFFASLGLKLHVINDAPGVWHVALNSNVSTSPLVNICDTGEGFAQVLPVLVALARAQARGPKILCLEQPELHLHTRAQKALAEHMVSAVRAGGGTKLLLETHSEVLLTSIQLALAEGHLKPEDVRVYWVESEADGTSDVTPVEFDSAGRPLTSALAVAFQEAVEIGHALLRLQSGKGGV